MKVTLTSCICCCSHARHAVLSGFACRTVFVRESFWPVSLVNWQPPGAWCHCSTRRISDRIDVERCEHASDIASGSLSIVKS